MPPATAATAVAATAADAATIAPSDPIVDFDIFNQLLEMDDEEDHSFSHGIVFNYFAQATQTFADMELAIQSDDLPALTRLGHFLKGSSASLGLTRVTRLCEAIQFYGSLKDKDGVSDIAEQEAKQRITAALHQCRMEYAKAETQLRSFYGGM